MRFRTNNLEIIGAVLISSIFIVQLVQQSLEYKNERSEGKIRSDIDINVNYDIFNIIHE